MSPASAWAAHLAREGKGARGGTLYLGLLLAALATFVLAPTVGEWSGTARWRYVEASTAPGAVVREVPAAVTVRLSDSVAAWSRLDVTAGVTTPDGFTVWEDAATAAGRDSSDPTHRTLAATLRTVPGAQHYRVEWTAYDPRGGVGGRSGSFYFGVGAPVPSTMTERLGGGVVRDQPIEKKNSRQLRALATVLLFILGAGAVRQWLGGGGAAPGVRRGGLVVADLPPLAAHAHGAAPLAADPAELGPCPACGSTGRPAATAGPDGRTQLRCRDCGLTGTPPTEPRWDAVERGAVGVVDRVTTSARAPAAREKSSGTALRLLVFALVITAFGACAAIGSLILAPFRGFGGG
jgi:hypothetical protein